MLMILPFKSPKFSTLVQTIQKCFFLGDQEKTPTERDTSTRAAVSVADPITAKGGTFCSNSTDQTL